MKKVTRYSCKRCGRLYAEKPDTCSGCFHDTFKKVKVQDSAAETAEIERADDEEDDGILT